MSVVTHWYTNDVRVTLNDGEKVRFRSNGRTCMEVEMVRTVDPTYLERMWGRGVGHDLRGGSPHRDIRDIPADAPSTWSCIVRTIPYTNQEAGYDLGNTGKYLYFTNYTQTEIDELSPDAGDMAWNTTHEILEFYGATGWKTIPLGIINLSYYAYSQTIPGIYFFDPDYLRLFIGDGTNYRAPMETDNDEQFSSIVSPYPGQIAYSATTNHIHYYNTEIWKMLVSAKIEAI